MSITSNMTEAQVLTVVRTYLTTVVPGIEVIRGQLNRVPEPEGDDFAVMWPLMRERIGTNTSTYFDDPVAQIIPNTSPQQYGPGLRNVQQSTKLTVQVDIHGPNSANNAQVVSTLFRDPFACDLFTCGPSVSAESSAAIETESDTGITSEPLDMQPLYAGDPRQISFDNGEDQVEFRWSVDLVMQINTVISVPQQFAGTLKITPINVDATYPSGGN